MKFLFDPSSLAMALLLSLKSAAAKKEDSKGGDDSLPCEGSTPGWVDVDGMGCGWYERNEAPGCPIWGDYTGYDIVTRVKFPDINRVGVANNNCCHCQGTAAPTVSNSPSTSEPTSFPSQSKAPSSPTPKPTRPCEGNTLGWKDVDGYKCYWYELNDESGCPRWGLMYDGGLGVAMDNCCYCKMTVVPPRE